MTTEQEKRNAVFAITYYQTKMLEFKKKASKKHYNVTKVCIGSSTYNHYMKQADIQVGILLDKPQTKSI